MTRNTWRNLRTVVRYLVYACCVIVVLFPIFVCGSFILRPFGGIAGSSEFANRSGVAAKRSMNEWPSNVAPSDVRLV